MGKSLQRRFLNDGRIEIKVKVTVAWERVSKDAFSMMAEEVRVGVGRGESLKNAFAIVSEDVKDG